MLSYRLQERDFETTPPVREGHIEVDLNGALSTSLVGSKQMGRGQSRGFLRLVLQVGKRNGNGASGTRFGQRG